MTRVRAGLLWLLQLCLRLPAVVRVLVPIGIMATLWYLSSRAASGQPPDPVSETVDNFCHVIAYFGLAGSWLLTFMSRSRASVNPITRQMTIGAIVLSAAYGIVDEVHQYFVPDRQLSIWDVLSDVFGSVTAVMFMAWLMDGQRRHVWLMILFVLLGATTAVAATLFD